MTNFRVFSKIGKRKILKKVSVNQLKDSNNKISYLIMVKMIHSCS